MTEDEKIQQELNTLVVDSPELRELEQLLGTFNIFRVLRFEHGGRQLPPHLIELR